MQGVIQRSDAIPDFPITFRINETGVLGGECADADSDEEFNPMLALDKYGAPFSF